MELIYKLNIVIEKKKKDGKIKHASEKLKSKREINGELKKRIMFCFVLFVFLLLVLQNMSFRRGNTHIYLTSRIVMMYGNGLHYVKNRAFGSVLCRLKHIDIQHCSVELDTTQNKKF